MKTNVIFLATAMFLSSTLLNGQDWKSKTAINASTGATICITPGDDDTVEPGISFEGSLSYSFRPRLAVYAGWGINRLYETANPFGENVTVEQTGMVAGVEYKNPFGESRISGFLRLGCIFGNIQVDNSDGFLMGRSSHGLGYQVTGGFEFMVLKTWGLTLGASVNSLDRTVKSGDIASDLSLDHLSLRAGISKRF